MSKTSFWNNIHYLEKDARHSINYLNERGILSDFEAEELIHQCLKRGLIVSDLKQKEKDNIENEILEWEAR